VRDQPPFDGFPAQFKGTSVPNLFLSAVVPRIDDLAELLATLFVLRDCQAKRSYPRFARKSELLNDLDLRRSLIRLCVLPPTNEGAGEVDESLVTAAGRSLERGLGAAVRRGTLASLPLADGDEIYCINSPAERRALDRVRAGDLRIGLRPEPVEELPDRPNVFRLYEDNIGPLTPIVADRLVQAEQDYPEEWVADAIGEAAENNARSWNYIEAILRRWRSSGRPELKDRSATAKESWEQLLGRSLSTRP